jgi:hypothetical protein
VQGRGTEKGEVLSQTDARASLDNETVREREREEWERRERLGRRRRQKGRAWALLGTSQV